VQKVPRGVHGTAARAAAMSEMRLDLHRRDRPSETLQQLCRKLLKGESSMRIHTDNEGHEVDAPAPVGPCDTFQEAMKRGQPGPSGSIFDKPTELSAEARSILENSESQLDPRREFNFLMDSGQVAKAFSLAGPPTTPLHKRASSKVHRVERDELKSGEVSVAEYDEDGRLLRAWITMDGSPPPLMRL
jgi:hypothetical protein